MPEEPRMLIWCSPGLSDEREEDARGLRAPDVHRQRRVALPSASGAGTIINRKPSDTAGWDAEPEQDPR
jgi:hypothetical protein